MQQRAYHIADNQLAPNECPPVMRRRRGRKLNSRGQSVCGGFLVAQQESAQTIRLRELSRLDDDLAQDHNRPINQLREQLHRYFPQLLQQWTISSPRATSCCTINEGLMWPAS